MDCSSVLAIVCDGPGLWSVRTHFTPWHNAGAKPTCMASQCIFEDCRAHAYGSCLPNRIEGIRWGSPAGGEVEAKPFSASV